MEAGQSLVEAGRRPAPRKGAAAPLTRVFGGTAYLAGSADNLGVAALLAGSADNLGVATLLAGSADSLGVRSRPQKSVGPGLNRAAVRARVTLLNLYKL